MISAVLRLRDPGSYTFRGLRSPLGAALRGGVSNTDPLTCTMLTLSSACADVDLASASAVVGLSTATASIGLSSSESTVT